MKLQVLDKSVNDVYSSRKDGSEEEGINGLLGGRKGLDVPAPI